MAVAIDINPFLKPRLTGVGNYALNLVRHLARIPGTRDKIYPCYSGSGRTFLSRWADEPFYQHAVSEGRSLVCPIPADWAYGGWKRAVHDSFVYSLFMRKPGWIFHGTTLNLPRLPSRVKKIVTVHDVAFLKDPTLEDPRTGTFLESTLSSDVRRADKIIAVSHATKTDLMELLDVPGEKIEVIYEGVIHRDQKIFSEQERRDYLRAKGLPDRFVLFVGTLNKRKNLIHLARAFRHLSSHDIALVVAGQDGNQAGQAREEIARAELSGRVFFTGFVNDRDLDALYRSAMMFVFPSLYEGFGLPVLEAMQYRLPVIAADNSSLKELFSDSAVLVDPLDDQAIAESIIQMIEDEPFRTELAEKSARRAREFSWDETAARTASVYQQLSG